MQKPPIAPQVLQGTAVPITPLLHATVALLGFGNQGRSHALNLRDSGVSVRVGGRSGSTGTRRAREEGFETGGFAEMSTGADLVIIALPDEHHAHVWKDELAAVIQPGQTIGFMHGLSVHAGLVAPPAGVGCVLVAPKGPGPTLRGRFVAGEGIPALMAVHQESGTPGHARALALAWAAGIGCGRAGVIPTTFKDEAETDLFGEQAVLCGGMLGLAQAAYETLVAAGYPPLLAYIECVHEIKQVADLLYERGPAGMREAISNTAEFGAYTAAPQVVDDHVRQKMKMLLADIQSGAFARQISADADAGSPLLQARRAEAAKHDWEASGQLARALMPWLGKTDEGKL